MVNNNLRPRLLWFAERVRSGVTFADIGTDHAKLPIHLVQIGKIEHAIASDIGEGPIKHAKAHIALNGLSDKIDTYIGDGISHLKITAPADIAICGMGGETIINILNGAPFVKMADIRLLLQPMTDFVMLRNYLADNGFFAVEEDIVKSDDKLYQCMIFSYNGIKYSLSDIEAELGTKCIDKGSVAFFEYVERRLQIMKKRLEGKRKAGINAEEELSLIEGYNAILKRKK